MIHDSQENRIAVCWLDRKNRNSGWLNELTRQFKIREKGRMDPIQSDAEEAIIFSIPNVS
jgi:hypothetical protein